MSVGNNGVQKKALDMLHVIVATNVGGENQTLVMLETSMFY